MPRATAVETRGARGCAGRWSAPRGPGAAREDATVLETVAQTRSACLLRHPSESRTCVLSACSAGVSRAARMSAGLRRRISAPRTDETVTVSSAGSCARASSKNQTRQKHSSGTQVAIDHSLAGQKEEQERTGRSVNRPSGLTSSKQACSPKIDPCTPVSVRTRVTSLPSLRPPALTGLRRTHAATRFFCECLHHALASETDAEEESRAKNDET
jgi:hypothetical protein